MPVGRTYTQVFDKQGRFKVRCAMHPKMKLVVNVDKKSGANSVAYPNVRFWSETERKPTIRPVTHRFSRFLA